MNILVVAAHPDDEVLGCGGTIARYAAEGHNVYILIIGEGVTSRRAHPKEADQKELENLHKQAEEVGAFLGAKEVSLAKFPDNRFDTVPLLDIVKVIEEHINRFQPEVVYTQHGGDVNIDHAVTYRAVITATRPVADSSVKSVYAYEVASSTEWAFAKFTPVFRPTTFVDIGSTLKKKVEAMQMYKAEARPFPHPRSPEALEVQAKRWGSVIGRGAAEAFELVREIV